MTAKRKHMTIISIMLMIAMIAVFFVPIRNVYAEETSSINYQVHVQGIGWQNWVSDGEMAGTFGQSRRLEAIRIGFGHTPYDGSVQYRTHVQGIGWQNWVNEGQMAGTSGQSKRLEAIRIRLTGDMAEHYDIWYRVHSQHFGWLGWAKNGDMAGTSGYAYRLEAIQIKLLPKGSSAPGSTANASHDKASETKPVTTPTATPTPTSTPSPTTTPTKDQSVLLTADMTEDDVLEAWGTPTYKSGKTYYASSGIISEVWNYPNNVSVSFQNGKVINFTMAPTYDDTVSYKDQSTVLKAGMTEDDVLEAWGTPTYKSGKTYFLNNGIISEVWNYPNDVDVSFQNGKVINFTMAPTYDDTVSYKDQSTVLKAGMTEDDVLEAWGTPTYKSGKTYYLNNGIISEIWNYPNNADVSFQNGKVINFTMPAS